MPAVEAAQAYGVRVHLWGIEPPYGTNQAERLVWESDTVDVLDALSRTRARTSQGTRSSSSPRPDIQKALPLARAVVRRAAQHPPAARARAQLPRLRHRTDAQAWPRPAQRRGGPEHVAHKWILTRGADNIRDLLPGPILPPVIDKELLVEAEKELGQLLRPYQEAREWLRDAFWARVHREFGIGVGKSRWPEEPATPGSHLGAGAPSRRSRGVPGAGGNGGRESPMSWRPSPRASSGQGGCYRGRDRGACRRPRCHRRGTFGCGWPGQARRAVRNDWAEKSRLTRPACAPFRRRVAAVLPCPRTLAWAAAIIYFPCPSLLWLSGVAL